MLKVIFIDNGMTHYYNQVLSKLNMVEGLDVILVVPKAVSSFIGDAVYQTKEGINFKLYELEEYTRFGRYVSLKGLSQVVNDEKPDIVVVGEIHLLTFIFNVPVIRAMRSAGTKLIMKSIPFQLPTYEEAKSQIKVNKKPIERAPRWLGILLQKIHLDKVLRYALLNFTRSAYAMPDAHVNYVEEAFKIYGSYGVSKDKIFIIYNSPDTDELFQIRKDLAETEPVLPECRHRLIHVGRLVEWKRVDLLIRAFARVKQKYADAELLIAGFGPEEGKLKQLCIDLNIESGVRFLGGIYDPKLLGHYLLSSTIYVLAGMGGLSINDAMAFGLPVICSVCDGTEKKLVREDFNGKYFTPGDENDLVAKIMHLFADPVLVERMGMNSTSIIKNEFNIHTVIQGYMAAFNYVRQSR